MGFSTTTWYLHSASALQRTSWITAIVTVWFWFGFGFGSCGSWSISVWFRSVFGTFCIDICFFPGVGKANTDCFPQEVYCFPQKVSWSPAFKERRELNSENQSFVKLSAHAIYYEETRICFFHWTPKAITTFPISLLGEVRRFRFLRFGFAHCSSGSRFLRFIGYLICMVRFHGSGSVPEPYCNHIIND